LKYILGGV